MAGNSGLMSHSTSYRLNQAGSSYQKENRLPAQQTASATQSTKEKEFQEEGITTGLLTTERGVEPEAPHEHGWLSGMTISPMASKHTGRESEKFLRDTIPHRKHSRIKKATMLHARLQTQKRQDVKVLPFKDYRTIISELSKCIDLHNLTGI